MIAVIPKTAVTHGPIHLKNLGIEVTFRMRLAVTKTVKQNREHRFLTQYNLLIIQADKSLGWTFIGLLKTEVLQWSISKTSIDEILPKVLQKLLTFHSLKSLQIFRSSTHLQNQKKGVPNLHLTELMFDYNSLLNFCFSASGIELAIN